MLLSVLAAAMLLAGGCGKGRGGPPGAGPVAAPAATPVEVHQAATGTVERVVTLAAAIVPRAQVSVVSKAPGRVAQVLADIGSSVRAGQVLVRLEAVEAGAQLRQAQAAYDTAQASWERMKTLYDEGAIPQQQWEQAELQRVQAQVALDLARAQADNAAITSPVDGQVSARQVEPGEMASPGVPLLTIVDTSRLYVEGTLTEAEVGSASLRQTVKVTVDALPGRTFEGKVASLSPAGDPRARSFPVKVELSDPSGTLKPGMFAKVALSTEREAGVVTIPLGALLEQNGQQQVFVLDGAKVRARTVKTGLSDGRIAAVREGLKAGEKVVIAGQHYLHDGAAVQVKTRSGEGR